MSTLFGVPPPPHPSTYRPGSPHTAGARPAAPRPPRRVRRPEPDRWRRRGVVAAAFLAVTCLMLANVATWLHFSVMARDTPSSKVAAATFDQAGRTYAAIITPQLVAAVNDTGARSLGPEGAEILEALLEGEQSKIEQIVTWATRTTTFRAAWNQAVEVGMARQRTLARGTAPETTSGPVNGPLLTVEAYTLRPVIMSGLVTNGYFFMGDETIALPDLVVDTRVTAYDYRSVLGAADAWWWLLWLLALGFGAAAFALASRRRRLGVIVALDVAVMLAGTVLLIPLMRFVARSMVVDRAHEGLATAAVDALADTLLVQTLLLLLLALATAVGLAALGRRTRPEPAPEPDADSAAVIDLEGGAGTGAVPAAGAAPGTEPESRATPGVG